MNQRLVDLQHDVLLREQTKKMLVREMDYMSSVLPSTPQNSINSQSPQHSQWRPKICEWCYRVIDHFQYDRKVVSIAMDYFDRFLLLHPSVENMSSREYQLSAMTCLYIAMKLHASSEITPSSFVDATSINGKTGNVKRKGKPRLRSFVELSRGQFSETDIIDMEKVVLDTLQWKVNPVTPMCFVSYLLHLIPQPPCSKRTSKHDRFDDSNLAMHVLHEMSRYLTELAICLPGTTSYFNPNKSTDQVFAPSSMAYASILLSMDMISDSALPLRIRRKFLESCARLSLEAGSSSSIFHGMHLHPEHDDIKQLKSLIKESFIPEMILEQTVSSAQHSEHISQPMHPIAIAKQAGLFNSQFLCEMLPSSSPTRNRSKLRERTKGERSPTSTLDGSTHKLYN